MHNIWIKASAFPSVQIQRRAKQTICKRNLVDSCTTCVSIKIAQIVGRYLNEQRSVLKRLVHQIAFKGVLVKAIHRTRHRHLTSTRHSADFSCQLQHLKTHIRNTKYDLHCFPYLIPIFLERNLACHPQKVAVTRRQFSMRNRLMSASLTIKSKELVTLTFATDKLNQIASLGILEWVLNSIGIATPA